MIVRIGIAAVVCAGAIIAVAFALEMPASDSLQLALIASAAAAAAGSAGAVGLRFVRGRALGAQTTVAALTSTAAMGAGAAAAAQAMFISPHDLNALFVVLVAAGGTGAAISLALGAQVSRTARTLGAAARGIAGGEHLVLERPGPREFDRLARELEDASIRLARAQERERALESSRRELVAWVSHDLRTPLAGIRAMVEALEDGVVTDAETVSRYHKSMRVEVDRLAGLVDDLFELSRIHSGALRLELERASLPELVSDAVAATAAVAGIRGVRLEGRTAPEFPEVNVAPPEIGRVLRNLLENAVRHTPSDGTVFVETGTDAGHAYVSVSDSCGGIPESDLERVFDVAFRGEPARTPQDDGGAGLGLAIARGIVEAHHGRIAVANEGQGCRFTVSLPLP